MKISKIHIEDYLHFSKKFTIDLTYPSDHPDKPGQPLDKVCFIGQSGTGKTSLLNIIKCFTAEEFAFDDSCIDYEKLKNGNIQVHYSTDGELFYKIKDSGTGFKYYQEDGPKNDQYKSYIGTKLLQSLPWLIFFPFNVVPNETVENNKDINSSASLFDKLSGEFGTFDKIWDLSAPDINTISNLVFSHIDTYIEEYKNISTKHMEEIRASANQNEKEVAEKKCNDWVLENPNPIQRIAETFLSELLAKLGLEIEIDLKYYEKQDGERHKHNFLILKQNGLPIPYKYLSTGTKQLILTALPLFLLEPKKSVVIFDQPEASLYPNIQLIIPKIYSNVAPDCQIFYATHSPVVASGFDPWEIVELKFDSDGFITQEKFYDEEIGRTMDSFMFNPRFMRWDSILTKIFDLEHDGSEERTPLLNKLAYVDLELKAFSKEDKSAEKVVKIDEYKKLVKQLLWKTNAS